MIITDQWTKLASIDIPIHSKTFSSSDISLTNQEKTASAGADESITAPFQSIARGTASGSCFSCLSLSFCKPQQPWPSHRFCLNSFLLSFKCYRKKVMFPFLLITSRGLLTASWATALDRAKTITTQKPNLNATTNSLDCRLQLFLRTWSHSFILSP